MSITVHHVTPKLPVMGTTQELANPEFHNADDLDQLPPLKSYWETAALWQFLYMFSDVLKVPRCDDVEVRSGLY